MYTFITGPVDHIRCPYLFCQFSDHIFLAQALKVLLDSSKSALTATQA